MSRHRHGRGKARRSITVARSSVRTRARACTGKRAFRSASKAMRDIDHKVRMGEVREALEYYTCRHCALIHVGHKPGYRKAARGG
jgi:hypothetical protein